MNRRLTSIFLGILISGCGGADTGAGAGTADNDCEDAHGIDAHIWYGDSHLKVSHKTTVKQEEAVLFKLHPDPNSDENVDYDEVTVHIVGKKPKDGWLSYQTSIGSLFSYQNHIRKYRVHYTNRNCLQLNGNRLKHFFRESNRNLNELQILMIYFSLF